MAANGHNQSRRAARAAPVDLSMALIRHFTRTINTPIKIISYLNSLISPGPGSYIFISSRVSRTRPPGPQPYNDRKARRGVVIGRITSLNELTQEITQFELNSPVNIQMHSRLETGQFMNIF